MLELVGQNFGGGRRTERSRPGPKRSGRRRGSSVVLRPPAQCSAHRPPEASLAVRLLHLRPRSPSHSLSSYTRQEPTREPLPLQHPSPSRLACGHQGQFTLPAFTPITTKSEPVDLEGTLSQAVCSLLTHLLVLQVALKEQPFLSLLRCPRACP